MNYQDQQVFFSPQCYILLIYLHHQKEMIAQHPAGPSVVLFKGKSFQLPIQRSRVKVPVLLHLQMLEVAYLRGFWSIKNQNIMTKSVILLGRERTNLSLLDLLRIMEFGLFLQMAMNGLFGIIGERCKIMKKQHLYSSFCPKIQAEYYWPFIVLFCLNPLIKVRQAVTVEICMGTAGRQVPYFKPFHLLLGIGKLKMFFQYV